MTLPDCATCADDKFEEMAETWLSENFANYTHQEIRLLASAFAAVRADERAGIVAWLREQEKKDRANYDRNKGSMHPEELHEAYGRRGVLDEAALFIEAGEHTAPVPKRAGGGAT